MIAQLARAISRAISSAVNKPSQRRPIAVTFWGKGDCSLCDRAHEILDKLSREYPMLVTVRDITSDQDAFDRYRDVIPVIEIEGGPRYDGKITEYWLRKGLNEARRG